MWPWGVLAGIGLLMLIALIARPAQKLQCPHCGATGMVRVRTIRVREVNTSSHILGSYRNPFAHTQGVIKTRLQAHCKQCGMTWQY